MAPSSIDGLLTRAWFPAPERAAFVQQVRAFRHSVALFNQAIQHQRSRQLGLAPAAGGPEHDLPVEPGPVSEHPSNGLPQAGAAPAGVTAALTPRQREIAALIANGRSNAAIAQELVLSKGTVANHVEHILNRLGFQCRAQIAVWAVQQGLLDRL